jgi:IS30 family transposase
MAAFWPPTMLTQEQAVEIKVLARRGVAIREIARQLGVFAQYGQAVPA